MDLIDLDSKTGVYRFKLSDGNVIKLVSEAAMDFACENYRKEITQLNNTLRKARQWELCNKSQYGYNPYLNKED